MKTFFFITLLITGTFLKAQTLNTGDKELDQQLVEQNYQAKLDLNKFTNDLSIELDVSEEKIKTLLAKKIEPSDVLMIFKISKIGGRKVEEVEESFQKNKDKGWGYIAKEMGIKPGSPEFHELKGKPKKNKKDKSQKKKK